QLTPQKLGVPTELRGRITVAADRQKDAVDVAEIVDHYRPAAHRGRQLRLDVVDLATELVPDLRDSILVGLVPDTGGDNGQPARRLRLDAIELTELLAGELDRVGDLARHFFGARAWVGRDDERLLDRELGVFESAEPHVRDKSADHSERQR